MKRFSFMGSGPKPNAKGHPLPDTSAMTTRLKASANAGEIEFTVTNTGAKPQSFCIFQTPLEDFRADILTVRNAAAEPMTYIGVKIKRNPPKDKHFVSIGGQDTLTSSFRLDAAYRLVGPGPYSVQFRGNPELNGLPDSNTIAVDSAESN